MCSPRHEPNWQKRPRTSTTLMTTYKQRNEIKRHSHSIIFDGIFY
jgi:hypothetical protein